MSKLKTIIMSYPKEYNAIHHCKDTGNNVFLIMPFAKKFDVIHNKIKEIVESFNLECKRADNIYATSSVMDNILSGILGAKIIIADLTDRNPNVFYELGISHSFREKDSIILLAQKINDIPTDLKEWPFVIYSTKQLELISDELKKKIDYCLRQNEKRRFFKFFLNDNPVKENLKEEAVRFFLDIINEEQYSALYKAIEGDVNKLSGEEITSLVSFKNSLAMERTKRYDLKDAIDFLEIRILLSVLSVKGKLDEISSHLNESKYDKSKDSFISKLCVKIIEMDIKTSKEIAIGWLIDYLKMDKIRKDIDSPYIDIEKFIFNNKDKDIDDYIVEMLDANDTTSREFAAKLCGEKKIKCSVKVLMDTIRKESNPYVVKNCVLALDELNGRDSVETIFNWMESNKEKWNKNPVSCSLEKIVRKAFEKLDRSGNYLRMFNKIN